MRRTDHDHQPTRLPEIKTKPDEQSVDRIVVKYIEDYARCKDKIYILEAGCGRRWPYDLSRIRYVLTGIDINEDALRIRQQEKDDLHHVVLGDLRTASFARQSFDIIYSCFVLEHLSQTQLVLANFLEWLKPNGLLILKFPDRDSVYGFIARMTPFCFHILYKKYLIGNRNAGKPGFGPFPTIYEKIIAREAFHTFIRRSNLIVREEYGFGIQSGIEKLFANLCAQLSVGRLTAEYCNLLYILEAQPASPSALSGDFARLDLANC